MNKANNEVYIAGEIAGDFTYSHTVYGEGFYIFDMKSERLSGKVDIIPVTISERLLEFYHLHRGDTVGVIGQIRSYNKKNPDMSNKLVLTVFAKDIVSGSDMEEHRDPNDVRLEGYICKQPNYRVTPLGRDITDILLAVNRAYHKSDYIPVIVWGRNAKYAGSLDTGDKISVSGRLQSREYNKVLPTGESIIKTAYEVSLNNIERIL